MTLFSGWILDIGIESAHGYLPRDDSTRTYLVGAPLLVRVEELTSGGRVVKVSLHIEQDPVDGTVTSLTLNHLMPGTVIMANPEKKLSKGIIVSLGNGKKGFVISPFFRFEWFHLAEGTPSKVERHVKVSSITSRRGYHMPTEFKTPHFERPS